MSNPVLAAVPGSPLAVGWPWALGTLLLISVALWVHQGLRGWLPEDHPRGGRKNHERPTPMAGLLVAVLLVVAMLLWGAWWTAGAVILGAVCGGLDDHRKDLAGRAEMRTGDPTWQLDAGLSWKWKAVGIGAASLLVSLGAPGEVGVWGLLSGVGLAFVVINAVNFLDNTDGVAAGVVAAGAVGWLLWGPDPATPGWAPAFVAIAVGFLPMNWPRPRAFLGDSGALALGCGLAALALEAPGRLGWPGPAVAAVPILDFTQVVLVRIWLAIPPWSGDRRHLPHLLLHLGVPRPLVAVILAGAAVAAAAALA